MDVGRECPSPQSDDHDVMGVLRVTQVLDQGQRSNYGLVVVEEQEAKVRYER